MERECDLPSSFSQDFFVSLGQILVIRTVIIAVVPISTGRTGEHNAAALMTRGYAISLDPEIETAVGAHLGNHRVRILLHAAFHIRQCPDLEWNIHRQIVTQ